MADPADRIEAPRFAEGEGRAPGRGRLHGRHILVIGAGTRPSAAPDAPIGNGRAIAVLCAREGAAVGCADRDADAAQETLRLVEKEGGRGAVLAADVSDPDACARVVDDAERALGGLDGVVLNVGIAEGRGLAGSIGHRPRLAFFVIPAKAGIQPGAVRDAGSALDSRLRGNDVGRAQRRG